MPSLHHASPTSIGNAPGITIVGAGGIGCALGHALCTAGARVTFVDANHAKIDAGHRDGVGIAGKPSVPATFVHFDDWLPADGGFVLLCTKCFDNRVVLDRLPPTALVIPVQNGFDRDLMARATIEGIASFVSECDDDRPHTRITRPGALHIGRCAPESAGALPAEVATLIDTLERHGCFTVVRVPDVLPFKHAKLMYNAAISPLAAVAGLDNSQLLTIARARALFFALLRENYGILHRAGIALGKVGPFHPDTVDRILRVPLVARAMALPFSRSLRNTYCSMSGDIPRGRTEIDNFNGYLIDIAGEAPCDLNRTVHALVTRMAAQRLTPEPRWLDEVAPAAPRTPAAIGATS